ncbi:MAG: helix-turn-helix domain-containing protein [Lachnospiraceae bacterium]|nr:helix-turn-helix domain-containing protein [Lachnospiraceae bacterium]
METLDKFITRKEVAKKFDVSDKCVYLWEKKFKIPSLKIGKSVVYKKEDVENILLANLK